MKKSLLSIAVLVISLANAQVGINTDTPQATLDVREKDPANPTSSAGIAVPQVNTIPTVAGHRVGQIVYITSLNKYYYYDGILSTVNAGWVPFSGGTSTAVEPWNIQGTTTPASLNTQNIYQTGSIAIGKNAAFSGTALDVEGAVRTGTAHTGAVGINSIVLGGNNNIASGLNSIAGGFNTVASGDHSVAIGTNGTVASGYNSKNFGASSTANAANAFIAGGIDNTASAINTLVAGSQNNASGQNSFSAGFSLTASSIAETVLGRYNAITTGTTGSPVATDAAFQIGNGTGPTVRSNALTVLKNSNVGIGITGTEASAKPTERLDVGSGNVRVRDINTNLSIVSTDKAVVADATGILKTVNDPLFHARLSSDQAHTGGNISTLIFTVPIATSPLYSYNTTSGVLTFNQAGNYLVTLQASFANIVTVGNQLVLGVRPVPDTNYLARGSHYNAAATGGTIGEIMNYTTLLIIPSVGYQIRFTAATNANCTILATETGGTGSGNVTNVTVQKI